EPAGNLLVGLEQAAHVAAEAVLVELVGSLDVPQAAAIRADFVSQDDPHLVIVPQPAELDLEVYKADADAKEETDEKVVDPQRELHDFVDLVRRRPAEGGDVLLGDHRVTEVVRLVVELDDRAGELHTLFKTQPLGEGAGGHVPHDHLERNDLHLADELLTHVEAADEVRRYADLSEPLED